MVLRLSNDPIIYMTVRSIDLQKKINIYHQPLWLPFGFGRGHKLNFDGHSSSTKSIFQKIVSILTYIIHKQTGFDRN